MTSCVGGVGPAGPSPGGPCYARQAAATARPAGRSAFSLVELLVAISIILLLAAVISPVMSQVKRHVNISSSTQHLRQQHLALKLYQGTWGGDGVYGLPNEMGYPLDGVSGGERMHDLWPTTLKVPMQLWRSPCGFHPDYGDAVILYQFRRPQSVEEAQRYKENLVTFVDINCNPADVRLYNTFMPRRGLGVLLSGSLVNKKDTGDFGKFGWWHAEDEKS